MKSVTAEFLAKSSKFAFHVSGWHMNFIDFLRFS